MKRAEMDLTMPVGEALLQGRVARTSPTFLCGSISPETSAHCRLEPDHTGPHLGWPTVVTLLWA